MPSNLKDTPFQRVNSPRWLPVKQRLPSGVQATESMLHRICTETQCDEEQSVGESMAPGGERMAVPCLC